MNAIELFHQDGKSAGVFYCVKCRIVRATQEAAETCCNNYLCRHCGKDTGSRSWLACDDCRSAENIRMEKERFEKAEKVTQWDGPVYREGFGYRDGFAADLEDLLDDVEPDEMPEYVWTCDTHPAVLLDYDSIIENATQEAHEDFDPATLGGEAELKAALDKFNEANSAELNWEPNFKRALLISKEPI